MSHKPTCPVHFGGGCETSKECKSLEQPKQGPKTVEAISTTPDHIGEVNGMIQELTPPVAQVEVYRKALESALKAFDCVKANDKTVYNYKGDGAKNRDGLTLEEGRWATPLEIATDEMKLIQALLTSKPEPVAPVRKWEAEDEVGKLGPGEMFDEGGMIYFQDLSPEVQDALRGRKV
jgi:hypothetical protein